MERDTDGENEWKNLLYQADIDGEFEYTETGFLLHDNVSDRKFLNLVDDNNNTYVFRSAPWYAYPSDDRINSTFIDIFYLNYKKSTNKFARIE